MPAHRARPLAVDRDPQQAMHLLLTGLAALIVTSILVLVGFFVIADKRREAASAAAPVLAPSTIGSRSADPQPLTRQEVFPSQQIELVAGASPYRITVTHVDTDCTRAATGELATLLAGNGCDQIVRATMTAPYGGYRVTAGIFNLADDAGAAEAAERAGSLIENGRGGFAAIGALGTFTPTTTPLAQAGWRSRGHYLLYCLISRPDGGVVADDDPYAGRITADLVEQYLSDKVIATRSRHA
ncbi:hypothetical protein [Actinoplanes sp. TFC3]|uniref:hypothetical protein n=1 Tax=Actinoplanes sp. TFC3 TaxID=1710355 RepID=UPI000835BF37|nr:hypothetical protein [Actinoplanes sp. TFC3]